MNRTRLLRTIVIPVVISLLATVGLYTVLSYRLTAPEKIPVATGQVVAAATAIPSRTVITRSMVTLKEVPLAYITPGTVRAIEACVGRVALVPLAAGEILMTSNMTETVQAAAGLSYAISPGKRAMTVQVDEISGVAGFPLVGDRVDLLWTTVGVTVNQQSENRTRLLLEDLLVLAVVQDHMVSGDTGAPRELKGYTSLTLEVTPEQAATIALAESYGRIRMVLRPAVDVDWVGEFEVRGSAVLQAGRSLTLASDKRIGLEVRVIELDESALALMGLSQSTRGLERVSAWQLSQLNSLLESGRGRVVNRAVHSALNRVSFTYRWMAEALPVAGQTGALYGVSVSIVPSYYGLPNVSLEATVRLQMVDLPVDGRAVTGNAVSTWGFVRAQAGEGVLALGLVSASDLQGPGGGTERMALPGHVSADLLSGKRVLLVAVVPSF